MINRLGPLALVLLLVGGLSATLANAGVPRTLLAEDFTATW